MGRPKLYSDEERKERDRECKRRHHAKNKDKEREYAREWRAKNREHVNEQARSYRKRLDPEKRKAIRRKSNLKQQFGITPEQYDKRLADQGGGCAACGSTKLYSDGRRFPVDHCHKTGKVRGILCAPCNKALGLLGDDLVKIGRLATYLQRNG